MAEARERHDADRWEARRKRSHPLVGFYVVPSRNTVSVTRFPCTKLCRNIALALAIGASVIHSEANPLLPVFAHPTAEQVDSYEPERSVERVDPNSNESPGATAAPPAGYFDWQRRYGLGL